VALLPALAVLAWRSSDRAGALARLAGAPLALLVLPLLHAWQSDDAWAWARAQDTWNRELSPVGPLGGIWDGLRAGWAGVRQLVAGVDGRVYWDIPDAEPLHASAENLQALAFLVLYAALTVVAWRRFGAPYGLFAAVSLAIPLSVPSERWPLLSLPRFGVVVFPFFLALAVLGERRRLHEAIAGTSAIFLGVAIVQWATYQWVS
jgi:hypothetical protein